MQHDLDVYKTSEASSYKFSIDDHKAYVEPDALTRMGVIADDATEDVANSM